MKKIICLLALIALIQNVFAKYTLISSYYNYTQGFGANQVNGQHINVMAELGDSLVLDAYFIDLGPPYFYPYQWYFNGDTIPNTTGVDSLRFLINQFGTYSAYINYPGFAVNMYFDVNNTTGISSIPNTNFLNVFPTAVTSSITIQLNSIKPNDIEITFYDINGKQLKTDFYKNISGEFIKNENTEALANGMYFLRIKTGDEVVEKKFVKM